MTTESNKILVTDSLFIYKEHEALIEGAGYEIVRLDKPDATKEELIANLNGAVGYILGGIEHVTDEIIREATSLRVLSFTGSGFHEFIPGLDVATKRGIAVSAAIGGNAQAVAEYTLTLILAMARRLPSLTSVGGKAFLTVKGFGETTVGIVGAGKIGDRVATLAQQVGFKVLIAKTAVTDSDPHRVPLSDLLLQADIVSLHVSRPRGVGVLSRLELESLRPGASVINMSFPEAIDRAAIGSLMAEGKIYLAEDGRQAILPLPPLGSYLASNAQTAFNTSEANKAVSDRVTASLLNLLATGEDPDLVNPEFKAHR